MKYELVGLQSNSASAKIAIRCPHCGHFGTFENTITQDLFETVSRRLLGIRRCPNSKCYGHLFFVLGLPDTILSTYPPETIAFEKEGIPVGVLNAFEEAIKCHSEQCYIASAIMIRKTLEEICLDRSAKGKTLHDRLEALKSEIVIPKELLDAMQELRLLGNDAAHIESQTFNDVGKPEIEVSIDLTKEILKSVYQYKDLLGKLKGLKKTTSTP